MAFDYRPHVASNQFSSAQMATLQGLLEARLAAGLPLAPVPASAGAPGTPGQLAADTAHLYVCVAQDTWRRVALTTW